MQREVIKMIKSLCKTIIFSHYFLKSTKNNEIIPQKLQIHHYQQSVSFPKAINIAMFSKISFFF